MRTCERCTQLGVTGALQMSASAAGGSGVKRASAPVRRRAAASGLVCITQPQGVNPHDFAVRFRRILFLWWIHAACDQPNFSFLFQRALQFAETRSCK